MLGVHFHHLEILDRNLLHAHMSGHAHAFSDVLGKPLANGTDAAGLVVAIPSVLAYNYIVSRVEGFILEIQTTSSEIVDLLVHREEDAF